MESSKLTNILLAIIAACLVAFLVRPPAVVPSASAQAGLREDETNRFTAITATSKAVKEQVQAIRAIATSIDGLSKSAEKIAESIDNLAAAITQIGGSVAESKAASATAAPASP